MPSTALTSAGAPATASTLPPAVANISSVAVLYSGWLGVRIPGAGREARRLFVDPLGADVIVAGTFKPEDCAGASGRCLLRRLRGLMPAIVKHALEPELSMAALQRLAHASPGFAAVAKGFKISETYHGLTAFAPVLGNPNVSVMRELHDLSRVYALMRQHERACGCKYERIIFSRLEFVWLARHPPLSALARSRLWVPSGQRVHGTNDRHAVMDQRAAAAYFGRWALLTGPKLLKVFSVASVQHGGPEDFLAGVLDAAKVPWGEFPNTAYLACCAKGSASRCFIRDCYAAPLRPECARSTTRATGCPAGKGKYLFGKYPDELEDAVKHARFASCRGSAYVPTPDARLELMGFKQRKVVLSVPSGPRDLRPEIMTRHVALEHERRMAQAGDGVADGVAVAALADGIDACPLRFVAKQPRPTLPLAGFCHPTPSGGDCRRDDHGSWDVRSERLGSLLACVRRCQQCERCHYVSYSRLHHDCSW